MKDLIVGNKETMAYAITFQENFDKLGEYLSRVDLSGRKVCVITDNNVSALYLEKLLDTLEKDGFHVTSFVFEAGEKQKNLSTIEKIYSHLIENKFERKDFLLALGGGVVGDMTGYAAATYLRGIDFVQVPTTLLAQVDSSVGGKTGVDFLSYKNMVGAFHQPRLVYMNIESLKTLPDIQFASGMGEVLKTALIRDEKFYEWIINHIEEIQEREKKTMQKLLAKCCEIKKSVVEEDPKEKGVRAILNLGHTIGHAIEKQSNFELLHGHCVALGTIAAAYISFKRDLISIEDLYEIRDMNVGFDLPISVEVLDEKELLAISKQDKKMDAGQIKFVLLKSLGHAVLVNDISDEEILSAIAFIKRED